ncbi:Ribosomal protein arginine N-methytransferase [Penicillium ucsense]|uniref:type I protein arginine methyltransferase n=1 Tax=Penicillium ucsense TaxID=2839758 RepID=A0A8J8W2D4_9EURO|nr:Ribosomal protein arginine N-methytransferase [Penicillium ucsense]KAF7734254.1 Ribosomal protein arginine N-methytransferase [Penicillium ucsense]
MASSMQSTDLPVRDLPADVRSVSDDSDSSNEEGWEDVEPEDESQPVVGLFSNTIFPDLRAMLKECKEKNGFDLVKIQKDLGLDFLDTIKLVNYVRSEVKAGNLSPDVSTKEKFADDAYLKPVLEDDAVLYSLDDITEEQNEQTLPGTEAERKVLELQEELERLQTQFSEYRLAVQKSLDDQLNQEDKKLEPGENAKRPVKDRLEDADTDYFTSYSYNTIHESMLKDAIRTDAYRDFVYENKHLFKDKVVLDVGCGTGILSMFCAKAGAKKVISVDNSDIIDRAREIVYDNGLGDVITCIRGKIEEVTLPVEQVDIIISEWMGYALLFEAMFDSVIYARDRYLAPGGLMVPSHATLRVAPYADPDFVASHVSFWNNVYGFKMDAMKMNIHDEALVRHVPTTSIAADSAVFLSLPLHTITVDELTFLKDFKVTLSEDVDTLDGWAIWFDIFFMPSADSTVPENVVAADMQKKGYVAFTTGPFGTETHWQQTICLIDYSKQESQPLKKGQVITGKIGYQKKEQGSRLLDLSIEWQANETTKGAQRWSLQ